MATTAKNKNLKQLLLNRWTDFKIISQECSLGNPVPNLLKLFRSSNKMADRAKNKKIFQWLLCLNQWMDFEIIMQYYLLEDPLPKLLKQIHSV